MLWETWSKIVELMNLAILPGPELGPIENPSCSAGGLLDQESQ